MSGLWPFDEVRRPFNSEVALQGSVLHTRCARCTRCRWAPSLEVLRAACGDAREPKLGLVREGFLADLVLVDGNPAENFRHLYAFGAIRMGDDGEMYRSRGIVHPIKDGVVIENARLMEEVARMVEESRIDTGSYITETPFRTGGTP